MEEVGCNVSCGTRLRRIYKDYEDRNGWEDCSWHDIQYQSIFTLNISLVYVDNISRNIIDDNGL